VTRGRTERQTQMLVGVPANQPIRRLRRRVDRALAGLSPPFAWL
jgi:hypothetical protein